MHAKIIQKASLLQFIELLLSLTQSGFPLSSALKILSEKKETKHLSEKIISKLENGDTFTKAICTLDNKLKNYETLLITAEETGDINPVLSGITEELSEDDENKKSLITVSLYPIFICFLALILSFILIKYGIPYINLIADVDKNSLIKAIFIANLWLVFSVLSLFLITNYFFHRYDFVSSLFTNLYYLNKSSVGMEESFIVLLREQSYSKNNLKFISTILSGLRAGETLYSLCDRYGHFDVFTVSWLFVASESGDSETSLKKICENYKLKRKKNRDRIQRFLEPALLVITGIYMLILIVGCIIPVFMSLGSKIL